MEAPEAVLECHKEEVGLCRGEVDLDYVHVGNVRHEEDNAEHEDHDKLDQDRGALENRDEIAHWVWSKEIPFLQGKCLLCD
jgi:hypothetical protein